MNILSAIIEHIKTWYEGEYIPAYEDDHIVCLLGHYKRPLLARILNSIRGFLAKYWQWAIVVFVAVLAIVVNIFLHCFNSQHQSIDRYAIPD